MRRRPLVAAAVATLLLGFVAACEQKSGSDGTAAPAASGQPIVVGSTLSLSGAFAATGVIHKIAGEAFVDRLNASGGLLGRPVRWVVRDDESDQAKVSTLYEQLITQDKVDLIMGPYATPNILSAMAVAARHRYVLPQHTAVIAPQLTYECQFPGWSIGVNVGIPVFNIGARAEARRAKLDLDRASVVESQTRQNIAIDVRTQARNIDTGAKLGLNHPMGPLELSDFIGNDVMLGVMDVLHRGIGDPKFRAAPLLRQMVAAGHLGRKAGRGFYHYDDKGNKLD